MLFIEKTTFEKKYFSPMGAGFLFLPLGIAMAIIALITVVATLLDAQMRVEFLGMVPFVLLLGVISYFCLKRVRLYHVTFGIYPTHITLNAREFRWSSIQYVIVRPAGQHALFANLPSKRAGAYPAYPKLAAKGFFEVQFNFREGTDEGNDRSVALFAVTLGVYILMEFAAENPTVSLAPVGVLILMISAVFGVKNERPGCLVALIDPKDLQPVMDLLQYYTTAAIIPFRCDYELHFLPPEMPREQFIPRLK